MTTPDIPDEELRRIAAPLTQPAAIRRWFARQGFSDRNISASKRAERRNAA